MAIVQISKIIHRTGANDDLPQLDAGELGYATDEGRLYIGNDPELLTDTIEGKFVSEILTTSSPLDFSRISGAGNSTANLANIEDGQVLGINTLIDGRTEIVNLGGSSNNNINLGNVQNVRLNGGLNGQVLQTNGVGGLNWVNNGIITVAIANVSQANPAVVTTQTDHFIGIGTEVFIGNVAGMTQLNTAGLETLLPNGSPVGTNLYFARRINSNSFSLHTNANLTANVDSTNFFNAIANTGNAFSQIVATGNTTPGGSTTQVQFNDAGGFSGNTNFTFDKATTTLNVTNIVATTVTSNSTGSFNGVIGNVTPNLATFSSVTINNNANVVGNIESNNVIANNVFASLTSDTTENLVQYDTSTNKLSYAPKLVTPPSSNDDAGIKGQIAVDSDYVYICVDTDSWVRTPIDTTW
jgi:hypothetical protein